MSQGPDWKSSGQTFAGMILRNKVSVPMRNTTIACAPIRSDCRAMRASPRIFGYRTCAPTEFWGRESTGFASQEPNSLRFEEICPRRADEEWLVVDRFDDL
jgi:hypothetical protein